MPRDWVDIVIATDLDAGELISRLDDPDLQGAWQDGRELHLYWPFDRWTVAQEVRLQTLLQELDPGNASPTIQVQEVPDRDWNRLWAESVKPLRVGRRLVIRPSWESVELRPHEFEIVLDPKQAFGTGHHPTTQMLLEWLQEDIRAGETVLDVGTGSGLLAMVALRLGAARALGIDHDPVAIECARDYARQNQFGDELALHCGELSAEESFDWVLANLDRHTLFLLAEKLAGCTKTKLLISGLLVEQREEIVSAFALADLYVSRQREREGWLALELTPVQSCEEMIG